MFVDEGERSSIFSRARLRDVANPAYPARLKVHLRKLSRITVLSRVLHASGEIVAGLESLPATVKPMAPFLDLGPSLSRDVELAAFLAHSGAYPRVVRSSRQLHSITWRSPLLLWSRLPRPELDSGALTKLEAGWHSHSLELLLEVLSSGCLAVALPIVDDAAVGYAIYSFRDITSKARGVWRDWARSHRVELYEGSHPDRLFVNLRDPRHRLPRGVRRLV
jgi:hypothetical protein